MKYLFLFQEEYNRWNDNTEQDYEEEHETTHTRKPEVIVHETQMFCLTTECEATLATENSVIVRDTQADMEAETTCLSPRVLGTKGIEKKHVYTQTDGNLYDMKLQLHFLMEQNKIMSAKLEETLILVKHIVTEMMDK